MAANFNCYFFNIFSKQKNCVIGANKARIYINKKQEGHLHFPDCQTNSDIMLETFNTKVAFFGQNIIKLLKYKDSDKLQRHKEYSAMPFFFMTMIKLFCFFKEIMTSNLTNLTNPDQVALIHVEI